MNGRWEEAGKGYKRVNMAQILGNQKKIPVETVPGIG
jgi:hypothetical protein